MEASILKALPLKKEVISVMVTSRCQANCAHCLCAGQRIPDLSVSDHRFIEKAVGILGTKEIRLTGGEPTLRLNSIQLLLNQLLKSHPHIRVELITNGIFARSSDACEQLVREIPNLKRIVISYDRFHAQFVELSNLRSIVGVCRNMGIDVSGFASISAPHELCDVIDYEEYLEIPFRFQQVVPIGNALQRAIAYPYGEFEQGVLGTRCPQTSSFIYIPSYGFTHCCSSLFFKSDESTRMKLSNKDIEKFINSRFYQALLDYTFEQLSDMAGGDLKFAPGDSCVCELCNKVVARCLDVLTSHSEMRCSA